MGHGAMSVAASGSLLRGGQVTQCGVTMPMIVFVVEIVHDHAVFEWVGPAAAVEAVPS